MNRRKVGISQVLATVLFIFITIFAAIAIAGFVFGMFGPFASSTSRQSTISITTNTTSYDSDRLFPSEIVYSMPGKFVTKGEFYLPNLEYPVPKNTTFQALQVRYFSYSNEDDNYCYVTLHVLSIDNKQPHSSLYAFLPLDLIFYQKPCDSTSTLNKILFNYTDWKPD